MFFNFTHLTLSLTMWFGIIWIWFLGTFASFRGRDTALRDKLTAATLHKQSTHWPSSDRNTVPQHVRRAANYEIIVMHPYEWAVEKYFLLWRINESPAAGAPSRTSSSDIGPFRGRATTKSQNINSDFILFFYNVVEKYMLFDNYTFYTYLFNKENHYWTYGSLSSFS